MRPACVRFTCEARDAAFARYCNAGSVRTRRIERCERCGQPLPVCICDLAQAIAVTTKILVLVHHIELRKTTNTGRLAALALGARMERWGEKDAPWPTLPEGTLLLLFPSDDAVPLAAEHAGATLVVPDGNWPQARKIARRVRAHAAGRVTPVRLCGSESRYAFRKTAREDALSTLESIASALGVLESAETERAVLALFEAFSARHAPFSAGKFFGRAPAIR